MHVRMYPTYGGNVSFAVRSLASHLEEAYIEIRSDTEECTIHLTPNQLRALQGEIDNWLEMREEGASGSGGNENGA